MDLTAALSALSAAISALAACVTYFLVHRQTRAVEAQVRAAQAQVQAAQTQIDDLRQTRDGQQIYQLMAMLLDIRPQIELVLRLKGRDVNTWNPTEIDAAHTVASRFHLVGLLVVHRVVPEALFAKGWYYSVPACREALAPFITRLRQERDPRYWSAFDLLVDRVRVHSAAFSGFAPQASGDA